MKLELNETKILRKIETRTNKAQWLLDQQVIKDSNFYAPEDTGDLQDSALSSALGLVEWRSVYASKQYYEDNNKSKDKNPRASMKWFEVAKAEKLKEWEKMANAKYNE